MYFSVALGLVVGNFVYAAALHQGYAHAVERSYFQVFAILCVFIIT